MTLAVTQALVDKMMGDIAELTLRAEKAEQERDEARAIQKEYRDEYFPANERILAENRALLAELQKGAFEVFVAGDGENSIRAREFVIPDVSLTAAEVERVKGLQKDREIMQAFFKRLDVVDEEEVISLYDNWQPRVEEAEYANRALQAEAEHWKALYQMMELNYEKSEHANRALQADNERLRKAVTEYLAAIDEKTAIDKVPLHYPDQKDWDYDRVRKRIKTARDALTALSQPQPEEALRDYREAPRYAEALREEHIVRTLGPDTDDEPMEEEDVSPTTEDGE
jgi:hypothetical protein